MRAAEVSDSGVTAEKRRVSTRVPDVSRREEVVRDRLSTELAEARKPGLERLLEALRRR